MKTLVVGISPSKKRGKSLTLRTLYKWFDVLNLKIVSFHNIYEGYGYDRGHNQKEKIKVMSVRYHKIIALGNEVSKFLKEYDVNHFKLPHPSGLNHQLNDSNFVDLQLKLCRKYLDE